MELSLFSILLSGFLGGLILNLMPCTLPVLSLKILHLIKLGGGKTLDILKHSLTYSIGIISSFLGLAGLVLIIQHLGGFATWGFQFQSSLFCSFMALLMTLLGLQASGLMEKAWLSFKLRYGLYFGLGGKLSVKAGKLGSSLPLLATYLQGVLTTVIGSACCGPFLGYAVGMSFLLPWPLTLISFTVVGLGMAFPYLLISVFPKSIRWIPKPGKWLCWVKLAMSMLMFVTAGWFIWIML